MALNSGDIAFVQYNADGTDNFGFVALVDIPDTESINFTDNGWNDDDTFRATEDILTWTPPVGGIAAGTVVFIEGTTASIGGVTGSALALSVSGDQILAYQGSSDFIAAINNEGAAVWQADATSSNTSAEPQGLTTGTNAVAINEIDNAKYTGITSGSKAELLDALNNSANWTGNDNVNQTFSGTFIVASSTTLAIAPTAQNEGNSGTTAFTFTVTRSGDTSGTTTVDFATSDGTAIDGGDYTGTFGTVTFDPGDTSETITVDVIGDTDFEADENFTVTLFNPSGGASITTASADGTIQNDDDEPTVSFTTASQSGGENGANLTITAQLSAVSGQDVTVPFTITGTATEADYTITSSPITIPAGSTTQTITIDPTDDDIYETDQTVIVTMGSPTNATQGGTTVHTATITDNEMVTIGFDMASVTVAENVAGGMANLSVEISNVPAGGLETPVSFSANTADGTAISGSDYTALVNSTASFPVSAISGNTVNVAIAINDDALDEPNETFGVDLSSSSANANLGTSSTTVTIADDDPTPTVSFTTASQSGAENGANLTITAQLSAVSGQDVTVPFTVTGTATGADYTITSSPITIPAGSTTQTITIDPTDDDIYETDQTVIVTMGTPTNATQGATTVHTATITDNEMVTLGFDMASATVAENVAGGMANLSVEISNVPAGGLETTVPFTLNTADGTAISGSDYTALVNSTASFPVSAISGNTVNVAIAINNDALDEADEAFTAHISSPSTNANTGPFIYSTVTITDDDTSPVVNSIVRADSNPTNAATVDFTVTFDRPSLGEDIGLICCLLPSPKA